MDLTVKKSAFEKYKVLYDSSVETDIDFEMVLPEFCGDIQKILKCSCDTGIKSTQRSGDRLTAEGESTVSLIYLNDNGMIDCCRSVIPFSKYIEVSDLPDDYTSAVTGRCEYINYRATGQRKVSLNGKTAIHFVLTATEKKEMIRSVNGGGVQTKTKNITYYRRNALNAKSFEMNETLALSAEEAAVGGILYSAAAASVDTVKSVNGKVLIKGTLLCDIIYYADDERRRIYTKRHTMPISQIIELEGITQGSDCAVAVEPCYFAVQTLTDSSGSGRLLEITCKLNATLESLMRCEDSVITDCFPTEFEIEPSFQTAEYITARTEIKETKNAVAYADAAFCDDSAVECFWCKEVTCTSCCHDKGYESNACAVICILYTDAEGKTAYLEKTVDIAVSGKIPDNTGSVQSSLKAQIDSLRCKRAGDRIEINITASMMTQLRFVEKLRACDDIKLLEDKKINKKSLLTVRYCEPGESLWDIASMCKTSVDAIREENELDGDYVTEKSVLLIPG